MTMLDVHSQLDLSGTTLPQTHMPIVLILHKAIHQTIKLLFKILLGIFFDTAARGVLLPLSRKS